MLNDWFILRNNKSILKHYHYICLDASSFNIMFMRPCKCWILASPYCALYRKNILLLEIDFIVNIKHVILKTFCYTLSIHIFTWLLCYSTFLKWPIIEFCSLLQPFEHFYQQLLMMLFLFQEYLFLSQYLQLEDQIIWLDRYQAF